MQPDNLKRVIPVSDTWYYVDLDYQVQQKPYKLLLPMNNRYHEVKLISGSTPYHAASRSPTMEGACDMVPGDILTHARNRSYEKLVGKLGDASSLGATLTAERRETWNTMVTIVERALNAARAIKKMNFARAAHELRLPYRERTKTVSFVRVVRRNGQRVFKVKRRVRRTYFEFGTGREYQKTLANGWLMYSYGIKPLAEDAYNCIDVLQRPFPMERITGANTQKSSSFRYDKAPYYIPTIWKNSVYVSVRQSCWVGVDNPNLWLANRLGLVNPATWLVEGIPMSFVVDWFSNLSAVVSSFTDFVGLKVEKPCVNYYCYADEYFWTNNPWDPPVDQPRASRRLSRYTRRTLGLVLPKLTFSYERFQWQRGLNAISLLVGLLPRSTKR